MTYIRDLVLGYLVAAGRAGQPDARSEPRRHSASEGGMSTAGTSRSAATTSITVRVPMTIRQRGGRKLVVAPDGSPAWAPKRARVDTTLIKALARAHRWKRMLDDDRYGSVSEMAAAEKLDRGYLGRIPMLHTLAGAGHRGGDHGRPPAKPSG